MDDDEFKEALKAALAKLRMGDRFQREIQDSLLNAGVSARTTQDVVSYLIERRFVDDRRTIINEIERRSGRRAIGREKMRAELLKRGAPEELLEEALAALPEGEEPDSAVALLRAKYGAGPHDRSARLRAGRFLASRGFELDAIGLALERFFGSVDDGDDN